MPGSVYIETTIVSYLAARTSRDLVTAAHQAVTQEWWRNRQAFDLFSSDVVVMEADRGDPEMRRQRLALLGETTVLPVAQDAAELAKVIVHHAKFPAIARLDALHVAVAAANSMDYLLTWNCRHLAGASFRSRIESACALAGFKAPSICTPLELQVG